jgi:hypothetical protein
MASSNDNIGHIDPALLIDLRRFNAYYDVFSGSGLVEWEHVACPEARRKLACAAECGRFVHPNPRFGGYCCAACGCVNILGKEKCNELLAPKRNFERHGERCLCQRISNYPNHPDPEIEMWPHAARIAPDRSILSLRTTIVLEAHGIDVDFPGDRQFEWPDGWEELARQKENQKQKDVAEH